MQTSSEVGFALQQLLFCYHSTPVSNFCHRANRWGASFYCSIALYQTLAARNPHETADIEGICIFANSFKKNHHHQQQQQQQQQQPKYILRLS